MKGSSKIKTTNKRVKRKPSIATSGILHQQQQKNFRLCCKYKCEEHDENNHKFQYRDESNMSNMEWSTPFLPIPPGGGVWFA